jgi:metal-responsive CopG/Arc/MetJ family transcriptional regulator
MICMASEKKNKIRVQAYVSPYLVEKMDALIKDKKFSSRSDFISQAIQRLVIQVESER